MRSAFCYLLENNALPAALMGRAIQFMTQSVNSFFCRPIYFLGNLWYNQLTHKLYGVEVHDEKIYHTDDDTCAV